jgi:hypothetical protein
VVKEISDLICELKEDGASAEQCCSEKLFKPVNDLIERDIARVRYVLNAFNCYNDFKKEYPGLCNRMESYLGRLKDRNSLIVKVYNNKKYFHLISKLARNKIDAIWDGLKNINTQIKFGNLYLTFVEKRTKIPKKQLIEVCKKTKLIQNRLQEYGIFPLRDGGWDYGKR